jgi:hypothetical protein
VRRYAAGSRKNKTEEEEEELSGVGVLRVGVQSTASSDRSLLGRGISEVLGGFGPRGRVSKVESPIESTAAAA